jgi:hypothetical protein
MRSVFVYVGRFHLPFENDELLSQEGNFGDELGLASA